MQFFEATLSQVYDLAKYFQIDWSATNLRHSRFAKKPFEDQRRVP
jgi:hypothetical protein